MVLHNLRCSTDKILFYDECDYTMKVFVLYWAALQPYFIVLKSVNVMCCDSVIERRKTSHPK